MRKLPLLIAVVVAALVLSLPTPARADFTVAYPDGSVAYAINFGAGLNVVALIDGFGDIFTIHSDGFSDPVLVSLAGFPASRAMLLFFLEFTPDGHSQYDLYVEQGFGFFCGHRGSLEESVR
jgi:hypothetical protein